MIFFLLFIVVPAVHTLSGWVCELGILLSFRIPEVTGEGTSCLSMNRVPSGFSDRLTFDRGGRKGLGFGQRKISSYFVWLFWIIFPPQEQERLFGNYSAT